MMAAVSHLPQVTASLLMTVVARAIGEHNLHWAGHGLRDTTRLASSPANIWADICATNGDHIGDALDRLIARLTDLRTHLDDADAIDALFADAGRWRSELLRDRD